MKIVIFGGTGTLGQAICKLIPKDAQVWIVSRCELRQKELRSQYPNFNYVIGDVQNFGWAEKLPKKADYVMNFAASKHIEVCEDNVTNCVKTNYQGVVHTYKYSHRSGAKYIFTSTDKAVKPINAYGMAKALGEKYLADKSDATVFRWGNILGSRGSFFHVILNKLANDEPIPITDPEMTRFWMHIDDAADFLWSNLNTESRLMYPGKDIMVACGLMDILDIISDETGLNYSADVVGMRPGEKIHEDIYHDELERVTESSNWNIELNRVDIIELVQRCLA